MHVEFFCEVLVFICSVFEPIHLKSKNLETLKPRRIIKKLPGVIFGEKFDKREGFSGKFFLVLLNFLVEMQEVSLFGGVYNAKIFEIGQKRNEITFQKPNG